VSARSPVEPARGRGRRSSRVTLPTATGGERGGERRTWRTAPLRMENRRLLEQVRQLQRERAPYADARQRSARSSRELA